LRLASRKFDDLSIATIAQITKGLPVDIITDLPNRTICQREIAAGGMISTENEAIIGSIHCIQLQWFNSPTSIVRIVTKIQTVIIACEVG